METERIGKRAWVSIGAIALAVLLRTGGAAAAGAPDAVALGIDDQDQGIFPQKTDYVRTDMVSDDLDAVPAAIRDPNLVNGWGIAFADNNPLWVNGNGTGLSTLYSWSDATKMVSPLPLVVTVPLPSPLQPPTTSTPTGLVFNDTLASPQPQFKGDVFIFATEDGTISGWQQEMPPPTPDNEPGVLRVDNPQAPDAGAVYKGLTLATTRRGPELFASNFREARVDVFDGNYTLVDLGASAFTDPRLPAHYAPFGIQEVQGQIYVTYALQDDAAHDDVKGPGHGFVDVYNTDGHLLRRFATRGPLNSPWAVALAPRSGFGEASTRILIGNFGDGAINVFGLEGGQRGALRDANGDSIAIDGLWGLHFGGGGPAGPVTTLFFSAGPHEEANGLFGKIEVAGLQP
jgi:uncharacterized protein (TIGR03118 family)